MRPANLVAAAITIPVALGARQQSSSQTSPAVITGLESPLAMWITPESTKNVDSIRPSKRLATTAAAEKPMMEASMMGLIVFSAAGLFLL